MKSVGFVDFDLENFHANVFADLLAGDLRDRGWRLAKCWSVAGRSGAEWALRRGIPHVREIADLADCDGIMILAPSNPEVHLRLAREVFLLGKPVYVDKPFAPAVDSAEEIFFLADRHGVPVFSTSALRCSASLRAAAGPAQGGIRHMQAWGGGRSFAEYAIHPVEMIVSVMGADASHVRHISDGQGQHAIHLAYPGGRTGAAYLNLNAHCPFQAMVSSVERTDHVLCQRDPLFRDLGAMVLEFFRTGVEPVPREETLAVRRILDSSSRGDVPLPAAAGSIARFQPPGPEVARPAQESSPF